MGKVIPDAVQGLSISQRLARNSAVAMACRVITAFISLATIPIVVGKLGVVSYGIWETLIAVASLSILFQSAISNTLLWKVSKSFGIGDINTIRRTVGIGLSINLTLLICVVPVCLATRYSIVKIINVPFEQVSTVIEMLPYVVGITICSGINESFASVINGSQRMGVSILTQAGALVLNYMTVIIFLFSGGGLWSLLAGQLIGTVTSGVILCVIAHRMYPGGFFHPVIPSRDEIDSMYAYVGYMSIGSFSGALRDQTDKLVLATFASPVWVGFYGIAARLASLILEFNRFFYGPLIAASGALYAQGDWEAISRLYQRIMTTVACCTCGIFILVISLYDRIMIAWLGEYLPDVTQILLLLVAANTIVVVLTGAGTSICKGIGRAGIETVYITLNLIANLLLTIILVMAVGPMGTVYASVSTWIMGALFFVVLMHRKLSLPVSATLQAGKILLAAIIVAITSRLVIEYTFLLPKSRSDALFSGMLLSVPVLATYVLSLVLLGVITRKSITSFRRDLSNLQFPFNKLSVTKD
jgi:O-antigen/teichoic acid export membrane protein